MRVSLRLLSAAIFSSLAFAASAAPLTPEFRTLAIGETAATLPVEGYEAFACGSNGGPALAALTGWADYARCTPDKNGFHEVRAEFGRRIGQVAERFKEQYGEDLWIERFGGTRMANFPVVMSLLFDDAGTVRGFRAVTDDRASQQDRGRAYLFRFRVFELYGTEGWDCTDLPPAPGETGVGDMFVKQVCRKDFEGKQIRVETHYFRKPGQTGVDIYGMFAPGEYESSTRWEVYDATLNILGDEP